MSDSEAHAFWNRLGSKAVLKIEVLTAIWGLLCLGSWAGRQTHQNPDGNRIAAGRPTDIHSLAPLDIPLMGPPAWLVSETFENGVLWVAVLENGTVQGFKVVNDVFFNQDLQPAKLPPGMPPLLLGSGDLLHCWSPPPDASVLTHGVVIGGGEDVAYIDLDGQLVIPNALGTRRLAVDALPDARILVDDRDRMLLLTTPTKRYLHGVLGDSIEAASFTIVDTAGEPRVVAKVSVGDAEVIEGTSLLWVDVNGDQRREIVATVSAPGLGARLRIYHESGEILAEGPAIGRSFRWRNQAAFFRDPHSAKWYLTDILTPHIGGTLEFFEWDGARLNLVGSHFGVTSHRIGSRNLDWALVGPFGLRNHLVMVQPNDGRTHLVAVGIEDGAAVHHWNVPLSGEIRTNLSSANTPSGQVALGIGTSSNRLRVWQPEERKPYLKVVTNDAGNPRMHIALHGHPDAKYQIQSSHDLQEWEAIGEVAMQGETGVDISLLLSPPFRQTSTFMRAEEILHPTFADVVDVDWTGEGGSLQFHVTLRSPDTGCDQYADWWEILSDSGDLIYRRVLLHSHVHEQPFLRSGGPVSIDGSRPMIIRAHMNHAGYGGTAYYGSPSAGFVPCLLPPGFGSHLETLPPLPNGCAF